MGRRCVLTDAERLERKRALSRRSRKDWKSPYKEAGDEVKNPNGLFNEGENRPYEPTTMGNRFDGGLGDGGRRILPKIGGS